MNESLFPLTSGIAVNRTLIASTMVLSLALLLSARPAFAQGVKEGIQGTGQGTISLRPEAMRLRVNLIAKASDVPEALKKLKALKEKADAEVRKLGAAGDSIQFEEAAMSAADNERQRQIEQMLRARMASKRGGRSAIPPAPSVTVSMALTADWPLKAEGAEDLIVETAALQKKIKEVDLAGAKAAEEPTAEEAELAEEMAEMQMGYNQREGSKPSEPVFTYVARIPEKDREQALASAFAAARSEAEKLAKAAGMRLDRLQTLQSSTTMNYGAGDEYDRYYAMQMARMRGARGGTKSDEEIEGGEPKKLESTVHVSATFSFEGPVTGPEDDKK